MKNYQYEVVDYSDELEDSAFADELNEWASKGFRLHTVNPVILPIFHDAKTPSRVARFFQCIFEREVE